MASSTIEPDINITDAPDATDWETWLYVTCGIGGFIILILLGVVIYISVRMKKQSQKSKASRNGDLNEGYVIEEDQQNFGDMIFGDSQLQPQILVVPQPVVRTTYQQDEQPVIPGPSHQLQPQSIQDATNFTSIPPRVTHQHQQPRDIQYDDEMENGHNRPAKNPHRRPEPGHAHPLQNGEYSPQGRPRQDLGYNQNRPGRVNAGAGRRHPRAQKTSYEEEMRNYRDYGSERPAAYFDDETSSMKLPRLKVHQKNPKRSSSISELATVKETEVDLSVTRKNGRRNLPTGAEQGWNYLKPMGLDRNFPLSSFEAAASRDERPAHRPVGRELSAGPEEFNKRKSMIEERAIRAAADVDDFDQRMPRRRRSPSPDDRHERRSELHRGGHRHSTSLSPSRYPSAKPSRRD